MSDRLGRFSSLQEEHVGQTGEVLVITGGACRTDWAGSRRYRRSMSDRLGRFLSLQEEHVGQTG